LLYLWNIISFSILRYLTAWIITPNLLFNWWKSKLSNHK